MYRYKINPYDCDKNNITSTEILSDSNHTLTLHILKLMFQKNYCDLISLV